MWLLVIAHVTPSRTRTGFREDNPADECRLEWVLDDIEIYSNGESLLQSVRKLEKYPNIKEQIELYVDGKIWELEDLS
jgi:hypothetical protein